LRVELVKEFVKKHFPSHKLLDYALAVETVTTSKKDNLILNVDGCVAVCFVDLLRNCGAFTQEEGEDYLKVCFCSPRFYQIHKANTYNRWVCSMDCLCSAGALVSSRITSIRRGCALACTGIRGTISRTSCLTLTMGLRAMRAV